MSGDTKSRVEAGIEVLGRDLVETRNQIIKNANTVGNLTAEVRQISKQLERRRQGFTLGSLGTYVLFVIVIGGGAYLVLQARLEQLAVEMNGLRRQHASAQVRLERLRDEARKRRESETKAMAFYLLMKARDVPKALKLYPSVASLPLTKVEAALFERYVQSKQSSLAYTGYATGMRAIDEKNWKRAVLEFRRSLSYVVRSPHQASLHYYLGIALTKIGSYKQAAEALETAAKAGADKLVSSQIYYHMGGVYGLLQQRQKALKFYKRYIKGHPRGSHARLARRQIKALSK
ncbi:MAG: tetratricopeptide repeat protein [Deltaproteobacteria bacterium]|nr:tetratricopeptide repeat protein [Deltaproteobacteria bacterium]